MHAILVPYRSDAKAARNVHLLSRAFISDISWLPDVHRCAVRDSDTRPPPRPQRRASLRMVGAMRGGDEVIRAAVLLSLAEAPHRARSALLSNARSG